MCCSEGLDVKIYLQQLWQDDDGDGDNGDDDNGQEGTSGAVKLYLQQMSQDDDGDDHDGQERGHRGPSNYICSKCRSCCSSPSSGCHCNLLIIWPANICIWRDIILALLSLYFSLYVFYTSVFVFEQISFLYFCPCLHLSKYTVLGAPYFRKGHLATVSLVGGKQTPQSPNQSMWHKRKQE